MKYTTVRWMALSVLAIGLLGSIQQTQAGDAGRKLGRGVSNALLGITEIPRTIMEVNKDSGAGTAATWGPIKGIWRFVGREIAGVHEIITFPIPWPAGYEPIIHPEFPWEMDTDSGSK